MNELITQDKKMQEMIQLARGIAQSRAMVLIEGESGTGKELMAQVIHKASSRFNRSFVTINAAQTTEVLLEAELFGFEKGAFSGAVSSKSGKLELAHGGTLYIEEISELSLNLQKKILRVLEEGTFCRLGANRQTPVDIRWIVSTRNDLGDLVEQGKFDEALYNRFSVVQMKLPALRARMGDVRALVDGWTQQLKRRGKTDAKTFSEAANQLMEQHQWPGNIRELQTTFEKIQASARGNLVSREDVLHHLPGQVAREIQSSIGIDFDLANSVQREASAGALWIPGQSLNDIERNVILAALNYHNGNRTHTARALGISIRTLRNKLSDYRKLGIFA